MERLREGLEKRGIRSRLDTLSLVFVQSESGDHNDLCISHEGTLFTIAFGNYGHAHFDGHLDSATDIETVVDFVFEVVSDRIVFVIYFNGSRETGGGHFPFDWETIGTPQKRNWTTDLWWRIRSVFGSPGQVTKSYVWSGVVPGYVPPDTKVDIGGKRAEEVSSAISCLSPEDLIEAMNAKYGRGDSGDPK